MENQSEQTKMAVMQSDLGYIKKSVDQLGYTLSTLDQKYVTRVEFWPVRTIVYTGAGMILMSVLGALIYLVTGSKASH